jgi:pimeloyl-ACP methyl ester carboxylesterase
LSIASHPPRSRRHIFGPRGGAEGWASRSFFVSGASAFLSFAFDPRGYGHSDYFVSTLIGKFSNSGVKYKGTLILDVYVNIGE